MKKIKNFILKNYKDMVVKASLILVPAVILSVVEFMIGIPFKTLVVDLVRLLPSLFLVILLSYKIPVLNKLFALLGSVERSALNRLKIILSKTKEV